MRSGIGRSQIATVLAEGKLQVTQDTKKLIQQVLDSGAKGYVLKSDAMRDLIAAVDAVRSNKTFFTPKIAQAVLDRHMKRMSDQSKQRPTLVRKKHVGT